MDSPLLCLEGLKKTFFSKRKLFQRRKEPVVAVDGVDLTLYPGQTIGIAGESGSGKSTLCRAAFRLIEPTAGTCFFEGRDLRALSRKALRSARLGVQFVFQDPYSSLNPRFSVGESVAEVLRVWRNEKKPSYFVGQAFERVGLAREMLGRYPHELSGGQLQRVCIARALILEPKLVVLDEAVSALDVSVQAQILNLLLELKSSLGLSYLFISHDLSVVRHIADEVLCMQKGKVVERAAAEELFTNPQQPYTKKLIASIPKIDAFGTEFCE